MKKDTYLEDGRRIHRWQDPDVEFLATAQRTDLEDWPWQYTVTLFGKPFEEKQTTTYSSAVDQIMDLYRLIKHDSARVATDHNITEHHGARVVGAMARLEKRLNRA